ncbi:hypothetical protein KCMC57_65130 (plasmid) [Kitasatospora sp. CMC57]|uniref:Uncharacterized protein n=1 Tax=Kitasatospora sp. CMC57 TaxID=3231513 RepID=A0AB33KBI0_9ACTN
MTDRSGATAPDAHPTPVPAPASKPVERPLSQRCADLETRINIHLDPNRNRSGR